MLPTSNKSKMKRRVAIMAALTVSLSAAPAVSISDSGIFAPSVASAAEITADDISVSNVVVYKPVANTANDDPGDNTGLDKDVYNPGDVINSGDKKFRISFKVSVPSTARAGDTFTLYVADDNRPESASTVQGIVRGSRTPVAGTDGDELATLTPGKKLNSVGEVVFTLTRDASSSNRELSVDLPMGAKYFRRDQTGEETRNGEIGVFTTKNASQGVRTGVRIETRGAVPHAGTSLSMAPSLDAGKGFSYLHIFTNQAINDQPHSTYLKFSRTSDSWRMHCEKYQSTDAVSRVYVLDRSDGGYKRKRSLTRDVDYTMTCTHDYVEIYVDNLGPNESLAPSLWGIAPYIPVDHPESDTDDIPTYSMKFQMVDGDVGDSIDTLRSKPFSNESSHPSKDGSTFTYTRESVQVPNVPPGNRAILNGPLSSSVYTVQYDDGAVTRTQSTKVPMKETQKQDLPAGYRVTNHKDVPDWVTVNPSTGEVTLSPGKTVTPRAYDMQFLLTHADNSTQIVDFTATVKSQADSANPTYPEDSSVDQGKSTKITKPTGEFLSDATFTKGDGGPSWATVNSDGSITVSPGKEESPGKKTVPVKVTYSDGSAETIQVPVTVNKVDQNLKYSPSYPSDNPTSVTQDETATVAAPSGPTPSGTKFSKTDGTPEWATVKSDGSITVNPGYDVSPGEKTIPVKVTYPDGTTSTLEAKVNVVKAEDKVRYNPSYPSTATDVKQGAESSATVPAPKGAPEGTSYKAGPGVPSWATVKEDGSISVKPGATTPVGEQTIPIVVTYPDNTTETINAKVNVTKGDDNILHPVKYPKRYPAVKQGESGLFLTPDKNPLPGTTYEKVGDAPDWVSVNEEGSITHHPGYDVEPGDHPFTVKITYPDGTTSTQTPIIPVTKASDEERYNPAYTADEVSVKQGDAEGATVPAPSDVPSGSEFTKEPGSPEWATVNEDGSITVKPGKDVPTGDYPVKVKITYPDGTSEVITKTVKVIKGDDNIVNPIDPGNPGPAVVIPGESGEGTIPGPGARDGVSYEGVDLPKWATVDPDTGDVNYNIGCDVEPGDYPVTVKTVYKDGTTSTFTRMVTVKAKKTSECVDPAYESDIKVKQGTEKTLPVPSNLPEGTVITAPESGLPDWVTVKEDGTVVLNPVEGTEEKEWKIPVKVTYPDEYDSTEIFEIPVTVTHATQAELYPAPDKPYDQPVEVHNEDGSTSVVPGTSEDHPLKAGATSVIPGPDPSTYPEGTKFVPGEGMPEWVAVDPETGELTLTPDCDVKPGEYTLPVTMEYPDGTSVSYERVVWIDEQDQSICSAAPYDNDISVRPGETVTVKPGNGVEGAKYEKTEGTPGWVTIDEDGTMTLTPPVGLPEGMYEIPVLIHFPDGTSRVEVVKIAVGKVLDNVRYNPGIGDGHEHTVLAPGASGTIPGPDPSTYPVGTKFGVREGVQLPSWLKINPETGAIDYNLDCDVKPGIYEVPIVADYPDGTSDEFVRVIEVTDVPDESCKAPATGTESLATSSDRGILARTGANVAYGLILGLLMMIAGGAVFLFQRRRGTSK